MHRDRYQLSKDSASLELWTYLSTHIPLGNLTLWVTFCFFLVIYMASFGHLCHICDSSMQTGNLFLDCTLTEWACALVTKWEREEASSHLFLFRT